MVDPSPLCWFEGGNILKQNVSCNNLKLKFDIIFLFELLNHSAALVSCILGASHMCSPSAEGLCVCVCVPAGDLHAISISVSAVK